MKVRCNPFEAEHQKVSMDKEYFSVQVRPRVQQPQALFIRPPNRTLGSTLEAATLTFALRAKVAIKGSGKPRTEGLTGQAPPLKDLIS